MNLNYKAQVKEVHQLELSQFNIGDIITKLEITQGYGKSLDLEFECGFNIHLEERGISFRRTLLRPDHDHDDIEHLHIHKKTGCLSWCQSNVNNNELEILRIKFGPRLEGQ